MMKFFVGLFTSWMSMIPPFLLFFFYLRCLSPFESNRNHNTTHHTSPWTSFWEPLSRFNYQEPERKEPEGRGAGRLESNGFYFLDLINTPRMSSPSALCAMFSSQQSTMPDSTRTSKCFSHAPIIMSAESILDHQTISPCMERTDHSFHLS